MKRILITTAGSRGDVQPFVALAAGLARAGFDARLLTAAEFRPLAESHGAAFIPMRIDVRTLMESQAGLEAMQGGTNPFVFFSRFLELARPVVGAMSEDIRAAAEDADLIVHNLVTFIPAMAAASKRGIPTVNAHLQPAMPSREYPPIFVPWRHDLPAFVHAGTWWLFENLMWQFIRTLGNEVRAKYFDLPPMGWRSPNRIGGALDIPTVFGYSPVLVPKPAAWSAHHHVTGPWMLPEPAGFAPDARLARFLAGGPPPLYIGFGSMTIKSPAEEVKMIVAAVQNAGVRAVLGAGWSGIREAELPPEVLLIGDTPHAWLFPQMSAVVHHGGAGTTSAALAAGVPQLICPFLADQPFWGHRLQALGVGPKPIYHRKLTADRLAAAIRDLTGNMGYRERARAAGEKVRKEDGVAAAVEVIEGILGGRVPSPVS